MMKKDHLHISIANDIKSIRIRMKVEKREYVRIKKVSTANNRRYAHLLTHSVYPTRKYTHIPIQTHSQLLSYVKTFLLRSMLPIFFCSLLCVFLNICEQTIWHRTKKGQRIKKNDDSAIIIFLYHRLLLFNKNMNT